MNIRTASLSTGISLAIMAVLAPIANFVLLPDNTSTAALLFVIVAALDIVIGITLWPILRSGGTHLVLTASALRITYGAVFAVAAGILATGNSDLFHSVWDIGLLIFSAHLALAGTAMIRSVAMPSWIGALLILAGLGYAIDSVAVLTSTRLGFELGTVTFFGEVVLIVWLLGWSGRKITSEPLPQTRTEPTLVS